MSFPQKTSPKKKASALTGLCASALAGVLGVSSPAHAAGDLDGVIDLIRHVPVASAMPGNVAPLPGAPVTDVIMEQDGVTEQLPVQPLQVESEGRRMSALPLTPDQATGLVDGGLPVAVPVANAGPTSDLDSEATSKIAWALAQTSGGSTVPSNATGELANLTDTVNDTLALQAGPFSPGDVAAATQAAVWHYSSGATLAEEGNSAHVRSMYHYLTSPNNPGLPLAGDLPLADQLPVTNLPTAPGLPSAGELPAPVEALGGQVLGPLGLQSGVDSAAVDISEAPEGVTVVDSDGNQVNEMRAGTTYFLSVPGNVDDPGEAMMSLVSAPQDVAGQVLSVVQNGEATDALVLTEGSAPIRQASLMRWGSEHQTSDEERGTTSERNAAVDHARGGGGAQTPSQLALTGNTIAGVVGVGMVLVGVGAVLAAVTWRRRLNSRTNTLS